MRPNQVAMFGELLLKSYALIDRVSIWINGTKVTYHNVGGQWLTMTEIHAKQKYGDGDEVRTVRRTVYGLVDIIYTSADSDTLDKVSFAWGK